MDKRIIILIAVFCTASLGFFMYRKMYYKHEGIRYTIKPRGVISVADSIVFQDQTDDANRWKWDFGDGEYSAQPSGTHTYMAPGKYNVKLTVYGAFGVIKDTKTDINVVTGNMMPVAASSVPGIVGPSDLQVGTSAKFESDMAAATYEWHVEGDPRMAGKTEKGDAVNYAFASAGVRTIVLKTTKPDHETRKSVTVMAAAAPAVGPRPMPMPVQTKPAMPKPRPAQRPNGGNLPDLDNGVEYNKER